MWKNCQTAIGRGICIVIILIVLFIISIASAKVTNEKTIRVEGVTIYDYGTAKDFNETGPVNITDNFTTSDSLIYLWVKLWVFSFGNELTLKVYSPDGALFYDVSQPLDAYYWGGVRLSLLIILIPIPIGLFLYQKWQTSQVNGILKFT